MRIISLLPSATEIVCAVGCEAELVGISHECDFPSTIRDRAVLTRARIDNSQGSRAIDQAVREVVLRDALSIYTVDEKKLAALAPDVIVTQDLCEVCAVSLDDVRAAVARLAHAEAVKIVSLRPTRLDDVFDDLVRVAAALDRKEAGESVRATLRDRVRAVNSRAAKLSDRPRVASIEWLAPIMLGGTWMPEMIELAGGAPVGVSAGQLAPTLTIDQLSALHPEVVLVKPCGFPIARTMEERALLEEAIAPLAGARVHVTDGNAYFNRPGPRLVESLEILAACVHPEEFADFAEKHARDIVRIR